MAQSNTDEPQEGKNGETRVDEILGEYLVRIDQGEQVDREEFISSHPEVEKELRSYFANADAVEEAMGLGPAKTDPALVLRGGATAPLDVVHYFGDYELLEELGRGGMGVVYKARQTSLNRLVAVKMLLAGALADPRDVERFHREAEAAANLQHPNIVAIHEVGEHEGRHYFSMELIEGRNLATMVRETPLPSKKAAAYLSTVVEAIDFSHAHGTFHRDLKPSNILIDNHDQPHVTDFGLARRTGINPELTVTGSVLGTAGYMPPEQAQGRQEEIGPASDVYSLGATLYDILTGRPPFRAETFAATLRAVIHDEPVAPRLLNRSVDRDLETICLKCLEKEPNRRYLTAGDLAADLRRFLAGEVIAARPVGKLERVWRWCCRNPVVAALTVAVFVSLLTGAAVSASLAVIASRNAEQAKTYYNRVFRSVDELYTQMGQDPLLNDKTLKPLRRRFYEAGVRQFEAFVRELEYDSRAENKLARAKLLLGDALLELGDRPRAAASFNEAKILLEGLRASGQDSSEILRDLGTAYERLGNLPGTLNPYARQQVGPESNIAERKHWHSKALETRQQLVRRDPADPGYQNAVVYSQINLSQAMSDGGEHEAAVDLLEAARRAQQSYCKAHPSEIQADDTLAAVSASLAEATWRSVDPQQQTAAQQASRLQQAAAYERENCNIQEQQLKAEPTTERRRRLANSLEKLGQRLFVLKGPVASGPESVLETLGAAVLHYEDALAIALRKRDLLEDDLRESWDTAALRTELAQAYFEINEALSLEENPTDLAVRTQRVGWIRKSRAVAQPVLTRDPSTPVEEEIVSLAKSIVEACDEDLPELEKAIEQAGNGD